MKAQKGPRQESDPLFSLHIPLVGRLTVCALLLSAFLATGVVPCELAAAQTADPPRRVNAPYFEDNVRYPECAVFWFGEVDPTHTYADVRVGYNDDHLAVNVAVFDRYLWYDPYPVKADLTQWDAVTLFLDMDGDGGSAPAEDDIRLVGQLSWWEEPETPWQTVYRGDGSRWIEATIPFTIRSGWRGDEPNNLKDDRGWVQNFTIPFESLGLEAPPPQGSEWGIGVIVHDRDDKNAPSYPMTVWPETMTPTQPESWGTLHFGLPVHTAPPAVPRGETVIRQGLDGGWVQDAAVGGTIDNLCPGDPYVIWNEWGDENFGEAPRFNLQNQGDISDWPCFAKYYITAPLDDVPADQTILSATLTLHQWGGSDLSEAQPSWIQILTVTEDWDESTVTWNNAPLAAENIGGRWVDPVPWEYPVWPGLARAFDVSLAAAQAHAAGDPLRLALYEADWAYHSGKYFLSSEEDAWNAEGRPTLRIVWGERVGTIEKFAEPTSVDRNEAITYTMRVMGSGRPLTLTASLPDGVSEPHTKSPALTYIPHRLTWVGNPAPGVPVTLTYTVDAVAPSATLLESPATLTQTGGLTDTAAAFVWVEPQQVFLPLLLRMH